MSAIKLSTPSSGSISLSPANTASNFTITVPAATTTMVGTDTAQTLTNKTIQGGAITSGTAVASTSGTSIDFTGIPSWAKRITVVLNGVSTSGTAPMLIRLGAGSVQTTGYNSTATNLDNGALPIGLGSTVGLLLQAGTGASLFVHGSVCYSLLGSNIWAGGGGLARSDLTSSQHVSNGNCSLSGTLDRIRITTTTGTDTFDAGSINILYE